MRIDDLRVETLAGGLTDRHPVCPIKTNCWGSLR